MKSLTEIPSSRVQQLQTINSEAVILQNISNSTIKTVAIATVFFGVLASVLSATPQGALTTLTVSIVLLALLALRKRSLHRSIFRPISHSHWRWPTTTYPKSYPWSNIYKQKPGSNVRVGSGHVLPGMIRTHHSDRDDNHDHSSGNAPAPTHVQVGSGHQPPQRRQYFTPPLGAPLQTTSVPTNVRVGSGHQPPNINLLTPPFQPPAASASMGPPMPVNSGHPSRMNTPGGNVGVGSGHR